VNLKVTMVNSEQAELVYKIMKRMLNYSHHSTSNQIQPYGYGTNQHIENKNKTKTKQKQK